MSTASHSFDSAAFIRDRVAPHTKELESARLKALALSVIGWVLAGISGLIFIIKKGEEAFVVPALVIGFIGLVTLVFAHFASKKFRGKFKAIVMKNLVAAAYPSFKYEADSHIGEQVYTASGIFPRAYERFEGDDLISGRIDKTDFSFSEVHTQYSTTSRDSKGRTTTTWHTIFKGIFFHADFHKHFNGRTFLLPDAAESFFGSWLGQGLQALGRSHGELVKLESPDFEREFAVYSSDQQECRYILSPAMMERLLEMKRRFDLRTAYAFLEGRVYVALATNGSHFEPSLWTSGITASSVEKHLEMINSIVGIVEELKLNNRIWTKE